MESARRWEIYPISVGSDLVMTGANGACDSVGDAQGEDCNDE